MIERTNSIGALAAALMHAQPEFLFQDQFVEDGQNFLAVRVHPAQIVPEIIFITPGL